MAIDCEQVEGRLFEHATGRLDNVAEELVARHIAGCGECALVTDVLKLMRDQAREPLRGGEVTGEGQSGGNRLRAGSVPVENSPAINIVSHERTESEGHRKPGGDSSPNLKGPHTPASSLHLSLRDLDGTDKPEHPSLTHEMWPVLYQSAESDPAQNVADWHPDTHELACFFYDASTDPDTECDQVGGGGTGKGTIAGHVATCQSCAGYLAAFARAEQIALAAYQSQAQPGAGTPELCSGRSPGILSPQAWKLIADWEESKLAQPKPQAEILDCKTVEMMLRILSERRIEIYEMAQRDILLNARKTASAEIVPVALIDRAGSLQGVELFRNVRNEAGVQVLKSFGGQNLTKDRTLHALLDYGQTDVVVSSDRINEGVARIPLAPPDNRQLKRADYFILND